MIRNLLDIDNPRSFHWGIQTAGMFFQNAPETCIEHIIAYVIIIRIEYGKE